MKSRGCAPDGTGGAACATGTLVLIAAAATNPRPLDPRMRRSPILVLLSRLFAHLCTMIRVARPRREDHVVEGQLGRAEGGGVVRGVRGAVAHFDEPHRNDADARLCSN